MIEAIELSCPSGHPIAVLFYKPEMITRDIATLALASLGSTGQFSGICRDCGKAAARIQPRQTPASEWAEIPELKVPAETPAALVVPTPTGGMRHAAVKCTFTPGDRLQQN